MLSLMFYLFFSVSGAHRVRRVLTRSFPSRRSSDRIFINGVALLKVGAKVALDRDQTPGDANRVNLPHPEIYRALEPDMRLLLDDGKMVLRVKSVTSERIDSVFEVGGALFTRKGVTIPDVVVPVASMTDMDRRDFSTEVRRDGKECVCTFIIWGLPVKKKQ